MAAPLVWIGVFPGTGKLTVARAWPVLDGPSIVIDNHQLDPVDAREAGRPLPTGLPVLRRRRQHRKSASHDRVHGTTTKLTDVDTLKDLRSRCDLIYPGVAVGTTEMTPEMAAGFSEIVLLWILERRVSGATSRQKCCQDLGLLK